MVSPTPGEGPGRRREASMPKRKSPPLRAAERREIERGLDAGGSVRSIAASIGRCPSTVAREVRANRAPANPALRARPEELPAPDCPRLQGSPGVCNACPRLRGGPCGHRRWVYRAGAAAVESDRRRRESRCVPSSKTEPPPSH